MSSGNELTSSIENRALIGPRWVKMNKKCILITTGATIAITIAVFLVIHFAGAYTALKVTTASHEHDKEPPRDRIPSECGRKTAQSEWPWTVEIYTTDDGSRSSWEDTIALGTLVNYQYVLSSAYAIKKHKDRSLGALVGDPGVQRRISSMKFITNESFDFRGGINLVLLRLDKAVEFNDHIQPICLPWVQPEIPELLLIYPSDEEGKLSRATVHPVDFRDCFMLWYKDGFDGDFESYRLHICVRKLTSSSGELCKALPGSPLLGFGADKKKIRYVQYGVKHYGDCTENLQIYTNVFYNIEWIRENLDFQD